MADISYSIEIKPKVSVLMLAYNHGEYIGQAIESILDQEDLSIVELIIGDDSSTDQTSSLCQQYQKQYPQQIRLISHQLNVGMHANFKSLWNAAKGEFITFCEGDDYWVDSKRIAKQLAYFSKAPEAMLCGTFTDIIEKSDDNEWIATGIIKPAENKTVYSFGDLIAGYNFHFSSVMLRKKAVAFPEWFSNTYCVDRPLYLLAVENGVAGIIPEVTSCYRIHDSGNWSALSIKDKSENSHALFKTMRNYFPAKYSWAFDNYLGEMLWSYMTKAFDSDLLSTAKSIYWKSLAASPRLSVLKKWRTVLLMGVRLYLPRLSHWLGKD